MAVSPVGLMKVKCETNGVIMKYCNAAEMPWLTNHVLQIDITVKWTSPRGQGCVGGAG